MFIPETEANRDDGENEVLKIANALNIELTNFDIQRAHRLGRTNSVKSKTTALHQT